MVISKLCSIEPCFTAEIVDIIIFELFNYSTSTLLRLINSIAVSTDPNTNQAVLNELLQYL